MEFTDKRLKIPELFGGIGACSKALERIGIDFEIADYVEIDKYAVASFNAINDTNFEPQDITKWDKDIDVDFIMHGSPCQDFSVAGKQAGGDEGSGTRSSLMYETIRIVKKLKPKYVIWENVKNLLSKKHRHNFDAYLEIMESLGYKNYYQVLNAKDYGIPQNRERVYTVSIRKDIDKDNFKFPEKEELKLRLKDMLEDEVDEKYYLSDKMTNYISANNDKWTGNNKKSIINKTIASTINTGEGSRRGDASNYISNIVSENYNLKQPLVVKNKKINKSLQETLEKNEIPYGINMIDGYNRNVRNDEISGTITTRVDASNNTYLAIKNATKKGYQEAYNGDGIDISGRMQWHRGNVQKQLIQTITTDGNGRGVVIDHRNMKEKLCDELIDKAKVKELDVINHSYTDAREKAISENKNIVLSNNESPTLTTRSDTLGVVEKNICNLRIRKLTPKECWRLMGFDDEDFEKAQNVNSNAQLYKQARKLNLCTSFRKNI